MLLEATDIHKTYAFGSSTVPVLKGASLSLGAGDTLAIMGKSGVGKSTLLHLLGALDHPTSGTIRYEGTDISSLSRRRLDQLRNELIGFVFQFHHLQPDFTALENIAMPMLIHRRSRKESHLRAEALLERVGLEHRLEHRPQELSGGEQQRVAIARALANEPAIVFADEPTGNLDQTTSDAVQDLLLEINREHGTALVVATHSRALAERLGSIASMSDGMLLMPAAT